MLSSSLRVAQAMQIDLHREDEGILAAIPAKDLV